MQQFNATNVVLNSIRLATPCKSGGWGRWEFEKFGAENRQFVLVCEKKSLIIQVEEKSQNSRVYGVLVELRWRSLSGLGCDEMQNFNATNVVLNSIRLATPSVKVAWRGG